METKRLVEIQSERCARSVGSDSSIRSMDQVIVECRRYIQDRSEGYTDMEPEEKRERIKEIITSYVMVNRPMVAGYVDADNKVDTNKLVDRLIDEIIDYGILTKAILDPDVYEIRANGKELKIEIKGRVYDYADDNGNIVSFSNTEQQDIILRKLLGDVRLTPKDAIVNARTVEGYRIAAVHSSAIAKDPDDPQMTPYHAFVLRKFRKVKLSLSDIVRYGTISDNMARLLSLLPVGGLTFVTVGPTASGKTTLNNAILQAVPPTTRTILLQNPSEIDLRFKDMTGRVYNDVLHLEATEKENPSHSDPTMINLMAHILRLSPTFVCFGELRTNPEFKVGMQIMQAGHPINCTYHSEDAVGALERFLTAYLAESGNEPFDLALATLTRLLNVIIVQKIMRDGTRKVIQISEVVGSDIRESGESGEVSKEKMVNDLYVYDIDEEPEYDKYGNLVKIRGRHRRVGKISDKMIRKFKLEGVSESMYDFMLRDVDPDEVETYDGVDK